VWTPINTQNTALTREAAAAYYYVRMGHPVEGLLIDRYGDILSGYLVQKCIRHMGQLVRVGTPVLDHRRTPHDLFRDLYHELAGMVLLEDFLPWLLEVKIDGHTYQEAYASLAEQVAAASSRFRGFLWDGGGREFLSSTASLMRTWLGAIRALAGQ
jgi:hypothetical protein